MIVNFLSPDHPVHSTSQETQKALRAAQDSVLEAQFASSYDFMEQVAADLASSVHPPQEMRDRPPSYVADLPMAHLVELWGAVFQKAGADPDVALNQSMAAAERSQLVRAFRHPASVLEWVESNVARIVASLPKGASDIRRGRNKGDVLDPYILAATQYLVCAGEQSSAVGTTMAHKALMVLEGMMGHLHEEVMGRMRGNMRVPEPRIRNRRADEEGEDGSEGVRNAGSLNLITNPFPGADAVQPPLREGDTLSFHQIKSKTGSMNSAGGAALGRQMTMLADTYGGLLYAHSLVGHTLSGHRSMRGIENAEPRVICTVGNAAFQILTRSDSGEELLLRVYLAAFRAVSKATGYDLAEATMLAAAEFESEAASAGEGFLESLLHRSTQGPADEQESSLFNAKRDLAKTRKLRDAERKRSEKAAAALARQLAREAKASARKSKVTQ